MTARNRRAAWWAAALLLAAVLMAPETVQAQCAMCRSVLEGSPEGRALGQSLNRAILVLLVAPYLMAGSFAALLFRRRLGERVRAWARVARTRVPLTGR